MNEEFDKTLEIASEWLETDLKAVLEEHTKESDVKYKLKALELVIKDYPQVGKAIDTKVNELKAKEQEITNNFIKLQQQELQQQFRPAPDAGPEI